MATPSTVHLPQPKNWDEFEEICADVFSNEWNDRNTTRYGRQGQRQNGVDIYGKPQTGGRAAVQCKGRRRWPPTPLRISDIDREVAAAKKFKGRLTEFIIATTAPDDARLQDHARDITERHETKGSFSVHIVGWGELTRRLTQYPKLVEKHYPFTTLTTIRDEIQEAKTAIPDLVIDRLRSEGVIGPAGSPQPAITVVETSKEFQAKVDEAIERDLAYRYHTALRRSMFPEMSRADVFQGLALEVSEVGCPAATSAVKRRILLRAARSAAVRKVVADAEKFLALAQGLAGQDPDLPAVARVAEARGDAATAIRLLRDQTDADSRSTLLHILYNDQGKKEALRWFADEGLTISNLTSNGVNTLAFLYLQDGEIEDALRVVASATDEQIEEGPHLLALRGALRLASLVPKPDQQVVLQGLPVIVPSLHPVFSEEVVEEQLNAAITDFARLLPIVSELELSDAKRVAAGFQLWCELLHPRRRAGALKRLRTEMSEPKTALSNVQFAFAFDPDFDPKPVAGHLKRRQQLGGLDDEELRAMLVVRLHADDPRSVADLISLHRNQFESWFGNDLIVWIEIQALAQAKDVASARFLLDNNKDRLPDQIRTKLESEIAKGEGADPVSEDIRVYETTKVLEALRTLVGTLIKKRDYRALGRYAEELYQQTQDPLDILHAAQAYANIGDSESFIRVVEHHSFLRDRDITLAVRYGWELFRSGRLTEAKDVSERVRKTGSPARDFQLEIAIAIDTGEWETLSQPLTGFLENLPQFEGLTLIQAAHLSQAWGQGPMLDLMKAAISKSENDAHVLIGAYSLILEEGLEEDFPEAQQWFSRALDLSGDDGPVKRFELKDLLPQQLEWIERNRKINESITRGDAPLIVAAPALNTTLVDIVLRNLVQNVSLQDARKRVAIPLFTGSRSPSSIGDLKRIAVDISSVLVLGWLHLLPKIFKAFPEVVLPAGTLYELFDGRRRIKQFQKSRMRRAKQVQEAIARGRLKVCRSAPSIGDPLVDMVGGDLTMLIRAAESMKGIVLRPAPVYRIGLDLIEADLSEHAFHISDLHTLLSVLVDLGAVDQMTENTAKRYFVVQDRGWSSSATPDSKRPLFIDDVALSYLQHTNLFDVVLERFTEVYIEASAEEQVLALIEHERHVAEILNTIDEIRNSIRSAAKDDKIVFGPRRLAREDDRVGPDTPTLNLLWDLVGSEAVIFDDRALNKEPFAQDQKGARVRCFTTLDILEELRSRGILSEDEYRLSRYRLRAGGAVLMALDGEDIVLAAVRSRKIESTEFRAIRESIALARRADVPRFPREIRWFASLNLAVKAALVEIWSRESNKGRARALADLIIELRPFPEDWVPAWENNVPPDWVEVISRTSIASVATPFELADRESNKAYNEWLEAAILTPLRSNMPDRYESVLDQLRTSLVRVVDGINDETS